MLAEPSCCPRLLLRRCAQPRHHHVQQTPRAGFPFWLIATPADAGHHSGDVVKTDFRSDRARPLCGVNQATQRCGQSRFRTGMELRARARIGV
ncbi:MAG: hypothetical protein K0R27_641 [Xanthobacteraceae bacterium]|nr:hypothetical protein [Xanthobacteraceae bacterium]